MKNKRGFTILEAVIALAVIVIVSATVLTIMSSSIKTTVNSADRQRAETITRNVIEAYRFKQYTSDDDAFDELLTFAKANADGLDVNVADGGTSITVTVSQGETELYSYTYSLGSGE